MTTTQTFVDSRVSIRPSAVALSLLSWQVIVATSAQITEFNQQQNHEGEGQVLALSGYRGNSEFGVVDKKLAHLREQKQGRVILELTKLSFATTMSLTRLLVRRREFRRQGVEFKLVGLSPALRRLAEMAGFAAEKELTPDLATALKMMRAKPKANTRPAANWK